MFQDVYMFHFVLFTVVWLISDVINVLLVPDISKDDKRSEKRLRAVAALHRWLQNEELERKKSEEPKNSRYVPRSLAN